MWEDSSGCHQTGPCGPAIDAPPVRVSSMGLKGGSRQPSCLRLIRKGINCSLSVVLSVSHTRPQYWKPSSPGRQSLLFWVSTPGQTTCYVKSIIHADGLNFSFRDSSGGVGGGQFTSIPLWAKGVNPFDHVMDSVWIMNTFNKEIGFWGARANANTLKI